MRCRTDGTQRFALPVEHPSLKPADKCPECPTGKVYAHEPREFVQVVGQPPLAATIYQIERLRCRLCDAVFSALMPEEVGPQKYDESAASMIAMLRYGSGMPFLPLEGLQACLHGPLPDAIQSVKGPRSVYKELI